MADDNRSGGSDVSGPASGGAPRSQTTDTGGAGTPAVSGGGASDLGGPSSSPSGGGSQPADIGGIDPNQSSSSSSFGWTTPYSNVTTPTSLSGGASTNTLMGGPAPVAIAPEEPAKGTIGGYLNQRGGKLLFKSSTGVVVNASIIDRTSTKGMMPKAMSILHAIAEGAAAAGIAQINVTAGKGTGHKSHIAGTEWDVKGYAPDGKLWTPASTACRRAPAQRAAVAAAGSVAGADRFGLYSFGKGYTGAGSLHIGYSGPGRPASVWGFKGRTGGDASRQFTDPAEIKFRDLFIGGNLSSGVKSFVSGGPLLRGDHLGDQTTNEVPNPRPRPDTTSPAAGARLAGDLPADVHPSENVAMLGSVILDQKRIIAKGETGDHVAELQAFLNVEGYRDANGNALTIDGNFGRLTKQAVKGYQVRSQIGVDGKVGPETYQAMLHDLDPSVSVMPGEAAYSYGTSTAVKIIEPGRAAVPLPRARPVKPFPQNVPDLSLDAMSGSDSEVRFARDFYAGRTTVIYRTDRTKKDEPVQDQPIASAAGDPMVDRGTALERSTDRRLGALLGESMDEVVAQRETVASLPDPFTDRGTALERSTDRRLAVLLGQSLQEIRARRASDAAMKQRFSDAFPTDKYRPASDTQPDLDAIIVRGAEALREFVRGVSDSYRRVIDQKRTAPPAASRSLDPFNTRDPNKDQSRHPSMTLLDAVPTASSVATKVYGFAR